MSHSPGPDGPVTPAPDQVNASIRNLIGEPPTPQRAEEYRRLLFLWADSMQTEMIEAA
ncbi:hypothetical protein ABT255_03650 [Streptomyces mirabilis]|uniref:hypothetical protein n=1 Tax=Streptomyces mirabilis TaxID=68239 RepID=UPI003319B2E7